MKKPITIGVIAVIATILVTSTVDLYAVAAFDLEKAQELLDENKGTELLSYVEEFLKFNPDDEDILFYKSAALWELDQYRDAGIYADKVLSINPNNENGLYIKAKYLTKIDSYASALEYIDKIIAINSENYKALSWKGKILYYLEKYEDAISYHDKALVINAEYDPALERKGEALLELGRYEEAIEYFDKKLQFEPDDTDTLFNKAYSLGELAKYEEAIIYYDKVLEINPVDIDALNNKGVDLASLGRYEEAISYYDKVLEIDPTYQLAKDNKKIALDALEGNETSVEAELYINEDYGFSLEYPSNWFVDDKIRTFDPAPGFDDGAVRILAFFNDNPDLWQNMIEIQVIKNDVIALNNDGQSYLDKVVTRLTEYCEIRNFKIDGYECSNHSIIDTRIFEIQGKPAYRITELYTYTNPEGEIYEMITIWTDIVVGNDLWEITSENIKSDYENRENEINQIIDSFKFLEFKEITIKQSESESSFPGLLVWGLVILIVIVPIVIKKIRSQRAYKKIAYGKPPIQPVKLTEKPISKESLVLNVIINGVRTFDKISKEAQIEPKELDQVLRKLEVDYLIRVEKKRGLFGTKIEFYPTSDIYD